VGILKIYNTRINKEYYLKKSMEKLDYYLSQNKIPNLIFHGSAGSGKKTLLNQFLHKIYIDKRVLEEQVMRVNCAFGSKAWGL
jgi:replication-associated recombination protein RarA